jgi:hypothetical protein
MLEGRCWVGFRNVTYDEDAAPAKAHFFSPVRDVHTQAALDLRADCRIKTDGPNLRPLSVAKIIDVKSASFDLLI